MTRTSLSELKEVLDTDLSDSVLNRFIDDAHTVVNNRVAPYTDDSDALNAVETYLAAHLATSREPRIASASHESVSVEYAEETGQQYWHQAILLDPTGRLARPNGYPVYTAT